MEFRIGRSSEKDFKWLLSKIPGSEVSCISQCLMFGFNILQIWLSDHTMEQMPMWCPPTPPTMDNDVYIDYSLGFLYENTPMTEAQLPPIYVKKERKRCRIDTGTNDDGCRPAKMRHKEESVYAPRSLFDRPSPTLMKMRRDMKLHKYRAIVRPPMPVLGIKTSSSHTKTIPEPDHSPDWMIYEDWSLLQSIQTYQALPLNLMILSPGHTPNWDLVADVVNNAARLHRSPKQCRSRYEAVIVPREEGKLLYDTVPKKQKKQKGSVYKTPQIVEQQSKSNRPMRTSQLYNQDKNNSFTFMGCQRFDTVQSVSNKRTPTVKPILVNPLMKNPNNSAVLAECTIQYDSPLVPIEVATRRADRIAKEKLKNAVLTVEQQQQVAARILQHQQQHQQAAQQQQHIKLQLQQQAQQQSGQQVASNSAVSQVHQLAQPITTVTSAGAMTNAKAASSSMTLSNSTCGNTVVTTTVKARPGGSGAQQVAIQQDARTTSAVVASLANIQAAHRITAGLVSAGQSTSGAVVAAAAASQKSLVGAVTLATASGTKTLTAAHVQQYYRQQQQQQVLLRQQQLKVLQAQAAGGQKMSVAVSATAVQQRAATTTLMKQGIATASAVAPTAVGKQAVTRTVSDTEMAALIKRQALQQQAKAAAAAAAAVTQVQVPAQTGLTPAQIFAQAGLQVQQTGTSATGTPVATLVKTANVAGVRTATPQQIRQLALHPQIIAQRKLPAQKVAQLAQVAGKAGVQTQLIVQQKSLSATMTVQQIQQVMKHVQPSTMQQFTHVSTGQSVSQPSQVVLAKSPLQTRVIPVASGALKQTIQVVTASNAQLRQATPIQGKPVAGNTVRRSPGPNPAPSLGPGPSTTGTAGPATTAPSTGSTSASNLSSASGLGQVRLQSIAHSQQTQQQQQSQQDAQAK